MGGGSWTTCSYNVHSTKGRGFATMDDFLNANSQELYRSHKLEDALNPYKVIRECCDSDEHPNTIPVILALDVTGSMGSAAEAVAKQLNDIMTQLYSKVTDVEFMTMAIGDLSYDRAPIQASQFESDIRIAEQLEKVYFEKGGGGNHWESYTAAWYFGLHNTKLDCWNRGRKGIIITMGDEPLNPYLPKDALERALGCSLQGDVDTNDLYKEVTKKFDIYHLGINDSRTSFSYWRDKIEDSWKELLGQHYIETTCENLYKTVADIIIGATNDFVSDNSIEVTDEGISW
jgi:hypothetical protein